MHKIHLQCKPKNENEYEKNSSSMFNGLYVSITTFVKPSIQQKQKEQELVELAIQKELLLDEIDDYALYELLSYNN